jgi:hypothetical protein
LTRLGLHALGFGCPLPYKQKRKSLGQARGKGFGKGKGKVLKARPTAGAWRRFMILYLVFSTYDIILLFLLIYSFTHG